MNFYFDGVIELMKLIQATPQLVLEQIVPLLREARRFAAIC